MERFTMAAMLAASAAALMVGGVGCQYQQPRTGPAGTAERAGTTERVSPQRADGVRWQDAHDDRDRAFRQDRQPRQRIFGIPEMAFPTGEDQSSLVSVSLQTSHDQARVGHPLIYRMRVTNLSDDLTLENVTVHQDLPGSIEIVETQPQGLMEGAERGEWNIGELSPGQVREFDVAIVPQEEGAFESCIRVTYNPVLCTVINVVSPQLQLLQEGPEQVMVCDPIPIRYTVANTGSGYTEPVIIQAPLPEGIRGPRGEREISIRVGPLGPGDRQTLTTTLQAERPGELLTGAFARTEDGLEAQAEGEPILIVAPQLEIQVQGPQTEFMDRPIEYRATVRNTGNGPALDTILRIDTQGRANLVSSTHPIGREPGPGRDSPGFRNGRGVIQLGQIPPGDSMDVGFTLSAPLPGEVNVAAIATAYCAGEPRDQLVTQIRGITSLLLELVDTNDPIRVGEGEIYRIAVTNQGSIPDTNVRIVANVPAAFEVVDIEGPTQGAVENGRIVFQPLDQIAPDERVVWVVRVIAREEGDHRFGVELQSDTLDSPVNTTEATRAY